MADYQAFNYGTPQQLADRAAAWQGYGGFGMGSGTVMSDALRNFLNTKIYPTSVAPTPPPGLDGQALDDWHMQNGFTPIYGDFGTAWDYPTPNADVAGAYQRGMGTGAYTSPDGRYYAHSYGPSGYMIDDLSRGPNEPTMGYYDSTGNFNHADLGAKNMTNWQGVLSVVGAALGFGALGAAAGGAGAVAGEAGAGAAAGGAEAGSAAGFVGEGAASGIGAWDGALAGAGGGAAAGAGAGAAASGSGGSGAGFVGEGAASGVPAWDGALANAGAGAATGTGGGFVGEGTTSGVPAWDSAAGSGVPPVAGAGGGSGGSGASTTGTTTGTPPPQNPYVTGTGAGGALGGLGNILSGSGTAGDYAGLLTSLLGAYAGSQGQNASTTSTRSMDPRMDALFYGALAPAALGTMGAQMPQAQAAGQQMMTVGSGLLGQTAPTTATNPYLSSVADDMQRRTTDLLGANNLATQGTAVATGGLGGSRQGVAQGVAAGKAADSLQGQVANLYGTAYAGDQNRLLQQQTLGAGLLSQGLDTQFQPLKNTGNLFSPFNGFGTTTNNAQSGGGALGALGGALGAAQYGHAAGWW